MNKIKRLLIIALFSSVPALCTAGWFGGVTQGSSPTVTGSWTFSSGFTATASTPTFSSMTVTNQINSASFKIGANDLTTSEWAKLDGVNQSLATTSTTTFSSMTVTNQINTAGFKIGSNELTTTEWAYLDGTNQSIATTSTVTFSSATFTNAVNVGTTTIISGNQFRSNIFFAQISTKAAGSLTIALDQNIYSTITVTGGFPTYAGKGISQVSGQSQLQAPYTGWYRCGGFVYVKNANPGAANSYEFSFSVNGSTTSATETEEDEHAIDTAVDGMNIYAYLYLTAGDKVGLLIQNSTDGDDAVFYTARLRMEWVAFP